MENEDKKFLKIKSIRTSSRAYQMLLKENDIILCLDGEFVNVTYDVFSKELNEIIDKKILTIVRNEILFNTFIEGPLGVICEEISSKEIFNLENFDLKKILDLNNFYQQFEVYKRPQSVSVLLNTIPTILLIQYLGNSMSKKGWGRIVVGSSIGVKFGGGIDTYCYSVTKYATELIPSISKQWYENNVLVNVVRIGVTDTRKFREIGEDRIEKRVKLVPMQRLAKVEEIAKSIYHLGSAENTYITGQIVAVSGGE